VIEMEIINQEQFKKKKRAGIPEPVLERAKGIVEDVEKRGFSAVSEYTRRFDNYELTNEKLKVRKSDIDEAADKLTDLQRKAIDEAYERVGKVQNEIADSALEKTEIKVGQGYVSLEPRPIERVGIYVPGGIAPLPSSLLMAGLAARAAGVKDIVVCTPPQKNGISPAILYVASKLGIDDIYQIGGAQAIAAMACGLPGLMKKTNMICGPGNVYAAAAKQIVSAKGLVKIDLVAGPSEVLIIADGSARADFIGADMLAQAEHGTNSPAILLTTSQTIAQEVNKELGEQLSQLNSRETAEKSLTDYGAIVLVENLEQAAEIANDYAPEHLEILTKNSSEDAKMITNAGAVFVNTCESFADYGMSGGNHILPTGGTARFLSGLSVYDFLVRTYVEYMPNDEQEKLAELAAAFADIEGLEAHSNAARLRGVKK
jgi:histidinol dehydrogenase